MSQLNHFAISSILRSEIVGEANFAHGQIGAMGDAQKFFNSINTNELESEIDTGEKLDRDLIKKAFLAVRALRNDNGSPDLYVADPVRNAVFLAKCREYKVQGSDYMINKSLLNARKRSELSGLRSSRYSIKYEDIAFACEFAATDLRYRYGVTVDDIICDPEIAVKFDSIANRISPGRKALDYRWALLSIRKSSGRDQKDKLPKDFKIPKFVEGIRLMADPIDTIPEDSGVYLLYEQKRLLYARSAPELRTGVEVHRNPSIIKAVSDKLWAPDINNFTVSYSVIKEKKTHLQAIENKIIEEYAPVFNVSRSAA